MKVIVIGDCNSGIDEVFYRIRTGEDPPPGYAFARLVGRSS